MFYLRMFLLATVCMLRDTYNFQGFGVPSIVVDDGKKKELVFGSDRFHILADILGELETGETFGPPMCTSDQSHYT